MIESLWILLLVGISSSLLGNILVQKQTVMVADAISHTILLGIVLAYFIVQNLDSPLLIIGATLFGVLTVYAIEWLTYQTNIQIDAAIGIVYTFFFALAVILISKCFDNVHLDIDAVLLGEIIFAPLNRIELFGHSFPVALIQNTILLGIILLFLLFFYHPLKLILFDSTFAKTTNIKVSLINFLLMTLVALHCVIAFQSVGAILVIALMVAPALSAQLYAKSFPQLLILGAMIACINSVIGYQLAIHFNVSMSGMVAVVSFIIFIMVFILKHHILSRFRRLS
ncbi:metal ABC transporter permease [Globicatella sanguinis]|uniref:metal ABC transporter permease n=1 Tax=Globicatella sanguinis TaxID=13076 RepID=UPI0008257469|nr:metal ABC transporter permease [Globicatella sanguinis]MDK7631004.1 metal ABC transporter permease [Globicatella sanguinis]WIK67021.1 metal ABC transporter permease [Globicatella sanguinis]WKT56426.1 metal ABC transporter permease [Globicatella sanguinis]